MKKNLYLWIFVGVAIIVCGMLWLTLRDMSVKDNGESLIVNKPRAQMEDNDNQLSEQEKVDLTQENIDFEDDAEDLSDGLIDDTQFDEVTSLDAIEGEVY